MSPLFSRSGYKQATFPFEKDQTALLGEIYRPMVEVSFWSAASNNWHKVKMLVDTGADYTIIPSYLAVWIGLDFRTTKPKDTVGVGGTQKVYFVENVQVKVGQLERRIPLGVIESTKVPPLMGRHHFFETFQVLFEKTTKITFAEE